MFQNVTPATAESWFQVKLYCRTGVWPLGAQVRTRWGRSQIPDSSMKTMVRPCLAQFFSACQRLVFQCRMAASSRWMARPLGRWQEKFSPLSNRQTPYSEYRLPLIVSIAFNPAGEDHRRFTNELHAPLLAPFRGMDGYLIRSLEHRRIRESSDVHRSSCRCRGFDFRDVCSRGRHRSICRGQEFSRP